jgi:hypothetical protein
LGSDQVKFRSQNSKNIGERKELTGSLYRYDKEKSINNIGWKSLMDKTEENTKSYLNNE